MNIKAYLVNNRKIAELISDSTIITNVESGVEILGNLYYDGFDAIIMKEQNISSDFFDLKTGVAGEILQKFSTYRMRLAVTGDFSTYISNSLQQFISESNRIGHVNFVRNTDEALAVLTKNNKQGNKYYEQE